MLLNVSVIFKVILKIDKELIHAHVPEHRNREHGTWNTEHRNSRAQEHWTIETRNTEHRNMEHQKTGTPNTGTSEDRNTEHWNSVNRNTRTFLAKA